MELSKTQIIDYLNSDGVELFSLADEVRQKCVGDEVYLRGLIEISNYCKCNCFYCGIRYDNKFCKRYRLSQEEIIESVKNAVKLGYKTIVLQSGEDAYYNKERICEIIESIKKWDVALTLSFGERTFKEYKAFKDAGADRYLLRIETTDETLYNKLHPNMSFKNRIECLKNIKEIGYELGTGSLIGLPNQTISSIADDILFFKEIEADMVGVGPFIPHSQTPLKNENFGLFDLTLKVIALIRILLENVNIPATTALETINKNGRILGLKCGANVVMPNVTDEKYKQLYKIYPNKDGIFGSAKFLKDKAEMQVKSINRVVSTAKGYRSNKKLI